MTYDMLCIGGPYDGMKVGHVPPDYGMIDVGPGALRRTVCVWLNQGIAPSWVDLLIEGYKP